MFPEGKTWRSGQYRSCLSSAVNHLVDTSQISSALEDVMHILLVCYLISELPAE